MGSPFSTLYGNEGHLCHNVTAQLQDRTKDHLCFRGTHALLNWTKSLTKDSGWSQKTTITTYVNNQSFNSVNRHVSKNFISCVCVFFLKSFSPISQQTLMSTMLCITNTQKHHSSLDSVLHLNMHLFFNTRKFSLTNHLIYTVQHCSHVYHFMHSSPVKPVLSNQSWKQ